jgi:hypothetical protein
MDSLLKLISWKLTYRFFYFYLLVQLVFVKSLQNS